MRGGGQGRVIPFPAQVDAAEHGFGGHRRTGLLARQVRVPGPVGLLHGVQEIAGVLQCGVRHRQAGHQGTLQRHQLPTHDTRVALQIPGFVARVVTPAAVGILCRDNEVDRFLGGQTQRFIAGHQERLAQHNGALTLRVHARVLAAPAPQVTVVLLILQQPAQSLGHLGVVNAGQMRLAGAEKGQEGQRRAGTFAFDAPPVTAVAVLDAMKAIETPAAIRILMPRRPAQAARDRRFGQRGATLALHHLDPQPWVASRQRTAGRGTVLEPLLDCRQLGKTTLLGPHQAVSRAPPDILCDAARAPRVGRSASMLGHADESRRRGLRSSGHR